MKLFYTFLLTVCIPSISFGAASPSISAVRVATTRDFPTNVRWYGAVDMDTDSNVDNTAAFQTAIDAASSGGAMNAAIYIPSGRWKISGQGLILTNAITIYGDNMNGQFSIGNKTVGAQLVYTGTNTAITIKSYRVNLHDFRLISTTNAMYGINIDSGTTPCEETYITRVNIGTDPGNGFQIGLHMQNASIAQISECIFSCNTVNGIFLDTQNGACSDVYIHHNHFYRSPVPIRMGVNQSVHIDSNRFEDYQNVVYWDNSSVFNLAAYNITFDNNAILQSGISPWSQGRIFFMTNSTPAHSIIIRGISIRDNHSIGAVGSGYAIEALFGTNTVITCENIVAERNNFWNCTNAVVHSDNPYFTVLGSMNSHPSSPIFSYNDMGAHDADLQMNGSSGVVVGRPNVDNTVRIIPGVSGFEPSHLQYGKSSLDTNASMSISLRDTSTGRGAALDLYANELHQHGEFYLFDTNNVARMRFAYSPSNNTFYNQYGLNPSDTNSHAVFGRMLSLLNIADFTFNADTNIFPGKVINTIGGYQFPDNTIQLTAAGATVKVDSADTAQGYLAAKLMAGSNVTITTNNIGGVESLTIASAGGGGGGGPTNLTFISPLTISSGTNVSIAANGIGNSLMRQSAAVSVVGNNSASTRDVADIVAGSDNTFLMRTSGALSFNVLPNDLAIEKVTISSNSIAIASRKEINFIPGTNITLGVVDNSASNRVDVTVNSSSGGGASVNPTSGTLPVNIGGVFRDSTVSTNTTGIVLSQAGLKINTVQYAWPSAQGTNGQVLVNNGSGTLVWATQSGGGSGGTNVITTSFPVFGQSDFSTTTGDYVATDNYADIVFDQAGTPITMQTDVLGPGTYYIMATVQFGQYRNIGQQGYVKMHNTESDTDLPNSERWSGPTTLTGGTAFYGEWSMTTASKVTVITSTRVKIMGKNGVAGDSTSIFRHVAASITWMRDTSVIDNMTVNAMSVTSALTAPSVTASNSLTIGSKTLNSWPLKKYITLYNPEQVDGVNCTNWVDHELKGRPTFSGTAGYTTNLCYYNIAIPQDIDLTQDIKVERVKLIFHDVADTGSVSFNALMYSPADNTANNFPGLGSMINPITLTFAGSAGNQQWYTQSIVNQTLTGWKSSVHVGDQCIFGLGRRGDVDSSTGRVTVSQIVLSYTSTGL